MLAAVVAAVLVALRFAEAGSRVAVSDGRYACVEAAFGPYVGCLTGTLFWFGSEMLSSAAVAAVLVGSLAQVAPAAGGAVVRAWLGVPCPLPLRQQGRGRHRVTSLTTISSGTVDRRS